MFFFHKIVLPKLANNSQRVKPLPEPLMPTSATTTHRNFMYCSLLGYYNVGTFLRIMQQNANLEFGLPLGFLS